MYLFLLLFPHRISIVIIVDSVSDFFWNLEVLPLPLNMIAKEQEDNRKSPSPNHDKSHDTSLDFMDVSFRVVRFKPQFIFNSGEDQSQKCEEG